MDQQPLQADQIFAHRYRIVRCMATGGMGSVYEVVHTETDRKCALKVMLPHVAFSGELRDRFKKEARVTCKVHSEYIVDVLDAGVDDTTEMPFLVMEYLQGKDLAGLLADQGRLDAASVVTFLHQAAMALNKTHAASIVHRDLKPENIFVTQRDDGSPRVKLLDFGISKVMEASTQGNRTMSVGTPLYMAPEQFKGKVSPATDIYALGMIAYTLLVGSAYWTSKEDEDDSVFALAGRIMCGLDEPASVRAKERGVDLPEGFDGWFAKATASVPTERFASAMEAVVALGEVMGTPVRAASRPSIADDVIIREVNTGRQVPVVASTGAGTVADSPSAKSVAQERKISPLLIAGAVVVLVVGGSLITWRVTRSDPSRISPDGVGTAPPSTTPAAVVSVVSPPLPSATEASTAASVAPAVSSSPKTGAVPPKSAGPADAGKAGGKASGGAKGDPEYSRY